MKKTVPMFLGFVAILLISCGNTVENKNKYNETSNSKLSKVDVIDKIEKCFENIESDYSQLLSKADILKYIDKIRANEIQTEESSREISYKWESDRKHQIKIGSASRYISDNNMITLSGINIRKIDEEKQALEQFDIKYRKLTEEESKKMRENIESNFKYKSKEEQERALSLLEIRNKFTFQEVEGLDTSPYWRETVIQNSNYGVNLCLLMGFVEFELQVKVSHDVNIKLQNSNSISTRNIT